MAQSITPEQFRDADGVDDWSPHGSGAYANFRTGNFSRGVEFIDEIALLAEAADHHPDVNLRYGSVSIRLVTHDVGGLSDLDVELARQISSAARQREIEASTEYDHASWASG